MLLLCLQGLSGWYWSSSQYNTNNAYNINLNNGYVNNNNVNNNNYVRLAASFIILINLFMDLTFEDLYNAYLLCLKHKKNKAGTYTFYNADLCKNLYSLLTSLNNRTYEPEPSNCYGITYPAMREIYAAQFRDRIVQHFYMNEINDILENELIDNCCACRLKKGTDYALKQLKDICIELSEKGTKDCYYLKIDLSGYFMSIDRELVSKKFEKLIRENYTGKYKDLLLYLTPIIFINNPAENCYKYTRSDIYEKIPERRILKPSSPYGMAIGNLTSQAGSNLNLNDFDHFIIDELNFSNYIRYVDDAIIVSNDKRMLISVIPKIEEKLNKNHQTLNCKKTKIDTIYHGIPFLGKITYPYGYQKPTKEVIKRTINNAKNIKVTDENILCKVNSQIGTLKNYNCKKLIRNYDKTLNNDVKNIIYFEEKTNKYLKT